MAFLATMNTIAVPMLWSPVAAGLVALVIVIAGVRALIRLASAFVVG